MILCEYSHSMGNSTGNIHKYWEAFEAHPHLQVGSVHRCACLFLPVPPATRLLLGMAVRCAAPLDQPALASPSLQGG